MRGNPEFSMTYSQLPNQIGFSGYKPHKLMWLAIAVFALLVAASDIALNVLKNKLNGEEEVVHEDEAEIEKYKALVEAEQQEAQAHGQVVNPDAGGTPAEPTHAQEELEHAEHQYHTDEGTLKGTETTYEWIVFASILLENRGIWLLKFLEELCAGVKTLKTELDDFSSTITNTNVPDNITLENKPSVEQEIKNIEKTINQFNRLFITNPDFADQNMDNIAWQIQRAHSKIESLKKKLKDFEDAALQVAAIANPVEQEE